MADYRKLVVWQRAHVLTLCIYRHSAHFPPSEAYGITAQLRRAAASVPANIAEGVGRDAPRDFARFCRIALGSLNEVEYNLLLARDLDYLSREAHRELSSAVVLVRRPLTGLARSLRKRS